MRNWNLALLLLLASCEPGTDTDTDTNDTTDTVDTETVDTETVDTDTLVEETETSDTEVECWVDAGDGATCWSAECDLPTSPDADSLKFLNHCDLSGGVVFDNAARIPSELWVPGNPLPPLP